MSNRKITPNATLSEQTNAKSAKLEPESQAPHPPEKPSPDECCGSGCVPCVFDYYYDALDKWQLEYGSEP